MAQDRMTRRHTLSESTAVKSVSLNLRQQLPDGQSFSLCLDMALLAEVHGLITDMLAESSLPLHVVSGLKALSHLLSPSNNTDATSHVNIGLKNEKSNRENDMYYMNAFYKKFQKKNIPLACLHQMSMWCTTTTATGMPILEPEPCRKRSASFRHGSDGTVRSPNAHLLLAKRSPIAVKSRSLSATSLVPIRSPSTRYRNSIGNIEPLTIPDNNISRGSSLNDPNLLLDEEAPPSSFLVAGDEISSETVNKRDLQLSQETLVEEEEEEDEDRYVHLEDGTRFDLGFLCTKSEWDEIHVWDYPIFDVSSQSGNCILSQMCYRVFLEVGLFETYKIPMIEFLNYFRALESGYRENPCKNLLCKIGG